jgi:hypothetical protein
LRMQAAAWWYPSLSPVSVDCWAPTIMPTMNCTSPHDKYRKLCLTQRKSYSKTLRWFCEANYIQRQKWKPVLRAEVQIWISYISNLTCMLSTSCQLRIHRDWSLQSKVW